MRRFVARVVVGLVLVIALGASAGQALVINTTFLPPGVASMGIRMGAASPVQAGGGTLQTVVRATADYWESIIDEPATLNLQFGWGGLPTGVLAETLGGGLTGSNFAPAVIQFANSSLIPWFLDSTPTDNSEFGPLQETSRDFGGGLVNIGLNFFDGTGDAGGFATDLFTVALHEVEHALGFFFVTSSTSLTIRDPLPFDGEVLPITSDFSHLNFVGPLMAPSVSFGVRELPSDIDILGLAQVNHWTDVTLNTIAAADVGEPASAWLMGLGLACGAVLRRRRLPSVDA